MTNKRYWIYFLEFISITIIRMIIKAYFTGGGYIDWKYELLVSLLWATVLTGFTIYGRYLRKKAK